MNKKTIAMVLRLLGLLCVLLAVVLNGGWWYLLIPGALLFSGGFLMNAKLKKAAREEAGVGEEKDIADEK